MLEYTEIQENLKKIRNMVNKGASLDRIDAALVGLQLLLSAKQQVAQRSQTQEPPVYLQ